MGELSHEMESFGKIIRGDCTRSVYRFHFGCPGNAGTTSERSQQFNCFKNSIDSEKIFGNPVPVRRVNQYDPLF